MAFRRRSTKRPSGGGTGGGRGSYLAQTAGGTKKSKLKQATGTSFGAAGQVGADQRLQMLVDRKDELKNLPGGMGDDRNLYQVMMNQFKNQNAQNRSAYASRFPISNFFTSCLPNIASKFMPGAGVLSLLANIGGKIKSGLTRASDVFDGGSDPAVLTSGVRQGPPAYDASGLAGYQDAIMRNLPPVKSTNPDDMGIMAAQPDFRFDGPFVPNPDDMMIAPKMTAKDYYDEFMTYTPEEQGFALGMNEGGLASINNPSYNMLKNASDFAL